MSGLLNGEELVGLRLSTSHCFEIVFAPINLFDCEFNWNTFMWKLRHRAGWDSTRTPISLSLTWMYIRDVLVSN